ncbi:hypothetical protein, partial [Escherichia coli]|uniref:hypothetical protein n=1 Tax=Escherichia coli TaxID=562 RepID=UPI0019CF88F3
EGWVISLRQKQKKLIMLPSETMIWQPEFTDKTLSRKTGAVQRNDSLVISGSSSCGQVGIASYPTICRCILVESRKCDASQTKRNI